MMRKRMTAIRASVADVSRGRFVKEAEGSYVLSELGVQLRRVVVVGFVVRRYFKPGEYASITIDDGTETIQAKAWGRDQRKVDLLSEIDENNLVLVIGRVREWNDEIFIDPETIRELTDPNFMTLHLLERYRTIMSLAGVTAPTSFESGSEPFFEETREPVDIDSLELSGTLAKQVIQFIEQRDSGRGVRIGEIIEYFESQGHEKAKIQMKVLDLQDQERILEVELGTYVSANK